MLLEIILGTIGGLVFAIGMCISLITEWDLLKVGIVVAMIGFMIPFCITPVYRTNHPKKSHGKVNRRIAFTWIIGIVGLLVCILNYPIYSYLKGNKE